MKRFILLVITLILTLLTIDFFRFPECYLTTWKYQLKNDIKRGNEKAIEYYTERYVANNRILFEQ